MFWQKNRSGMLFQQKHLQVWFNNLFQLLLYQSTMHRLDIITKDSVSSFCKRIILMLYQ